MFSDVNFTARIPHQKHEATLKLNNPNAIRVFKSEHVTNLSNERSWCRVCVRTRKVKQLKLRGVRDLKRGTFKIIRQFVYPKHRSTCSLFVYTSRHVTNGKVLPAAVCGHAKQLRVSVLGVITQWCVSKASQKFFQEASLRGQWDENGGLLTCAEYRLKMSNKQRSQDFIFSLKKKEDDITNTKCTYTLND